MLVYIVKTYPFVLSFFLGLIPALIWLWFWLKEDTHPESAKNLTLAFVGGMISVFLVLPLQQIVYDRFNGEDNIAFALWAAIEEICKFTFIYFIALKRRITDEPVDDLIYLIVGALGFVAIENALFFIEPVRNGDIVKAIVNVNLRFLGASLIHIMSSATIGICMALAFYKSRARKIEYTIFGLILAIILHTGFNLFIINEVGGNIFFIFGMVWVGTIVLLLLFEKIKNITHKYEG